MEITIRTFNKNISKVLNEVATTGQEIVITKHNKPFVMINVATELPKSEGIEGKVATKPEIIATLKQQTEEIVANKPSEKHYCLQCKALGKPFVEAVGEFEVTAEDGEHKVWLCQRHRPR